VKQSRGFTLIEALVALAIASLALVALMGRLGASADVQRSLSLHDLSLDVARNILAQEQLKGRLSGDEKQGEVEAAGVQFTWRTWSEKTMLDHFVRRNVAVRVGDEPALKLFIYRVNDAP